MENDVTLATGNNSDTSIKNALQFCSRIILVTGFVVMNCTNVMRTRAISLLFTPRLCAGFTHISKGRSTRGKKEYCFLTHGDMPTLTIDIFRKSGRYEMMAQYCHSIMAFPASDFSIKAMPDAGNPASQYHHMRQALLMGDHYSVEIENAEKF